MLGGEFLDMVEVDWDGGFRVIKELSGLFRFSDVSEVYIGHGSLTA